MFEARHLFAHADLQAARDGFLICEASTRLYLTAYFFITAFEEGDERRRAKLFARHHNGLETGGFTEGPQEAAVIAARCLEGGELGKGDGPRIERGENEDAENDVGERRPVADEIPDVRFL